MQYFKGGLHGAWLFVSPIATLTLSHVSASFATASFITTHSMLIMI